MGLIETIENFKMSKKFKYIFFGMLCVLFPLVITIYGIVYFGGLWDPLGKLKNLKVTIVNKDVGCPPDTNLLCLILSSQLPPTMPIQAIKIGDTIVESIKQNDQAKDIFNWQFEDLTYEQSKQTVEDYDRWGVIYIPEDFTQNILSQIDKSGMSNVTAIITPILQATGMTQVDLIKKYGPNALASLAESTQASIDYIYDTARSYTSVTFVTTVFETIDKTLKKGVSLNLYQKVVATGLAKFNNKFYLNAYDSNYVDIHPLNNFGQNFASFMLFLIIYISAIATNLVYRKYRPFNNYIQTKKTNGSIITSAFAKIGINMIYMLVVCAFMMLVMFMFGKAQHEKNTFCIYLIFVLWAFISLTFCHIISNLLPLLPFLGICVIFLVVQLATCGGIIANQLQPGFWNVGKAFPMYYATAEMKYLLFGTGGRFNGRNILALLLWAVGLAVVDLLTCIFQLRNIRKAAPSETTDLEKQNTIETQQQNARVTQQDIEDNENDITNMK
ncbi:hypothetical protein BCR36DRAFT_364482 [Piromyces finnis]|uniref:ABC-2 type transporter transmembrane domain-containing protein n=1 Tax=Piromyces finnis TaxID=1754191 RepID=A0A1Y1UV90_9FUNG|nr:hypothetical protein BCR36DRAFT_364482 [Piromyces finnis]|eukprot:ORX41386.1 hypothetical protein BCR36DRAFT_364482 [Piromyces finnis]